MIYDFAIKLRLLQIGINMRLKQYDIAKGIALVSVIFIHTCGIPLIGKYVHGFFMPIFFFVSGFFLYNSLSHPFKDFLRDKIYRLLCPWAIGNCFIGVTILCLRSYGINIVDNKISWQQIMLGWMYGRYMLMSDIGNPLILFLNPINAPLWFLPAIFLSSLCLYPLSRILNAEKRVLKTLLIITVLALIQKPFNMSVYLLPWSMDSLPILVLFMLFGYLFRQNIERIDSILTNKLTNAIIMFFLTIIYCVLVNLNGMVNISLRNFGNFYIVYVTAGLIGSFLAIQYSKMIMGIKVSALFSLLGRKTMPIFMFHMLVIGCLKEFLGLVGITFSLVENIAAYYLKNCILIVITIIIILVAEVIWKKVFLKSK